MDNEEKNEQVEVVEKEVLGESSPATKEELRQMKEMFYDDDLTGGFQNIDIPDEEIEKMKEQEEKALEFIEMAESESHTDICHRTDKVTVKFTPEEMAMVIEIMEKFSNKIEYLHYASDVLKMDNLYDHQTIVRNIRDKVDGVLDEYVKIRPYTPFLNGWIKKIGKENVRKMQD